MIVIFHPQSGPTSGSGKTNCSKKWYWCYSGNCILTVTMLCVDPENIISVAWLQFPLNIHISIQYLMYCSVNDFFFAFILRKNLHCAKYHHFIFVSCLYCFYFKIEFFILNWLLHNLELMQRNWFLFNAKFFSGSVWNVFAFVFFILNSFYMCIQYINTKNVTVRIKMSKCTF